ncbi:IclR family transcriptional regulator [Devosia sp.]|uniref:IclR family transcriptional regulator n=1 Tax=Devosia sp. TaxID=1871048 RepID=UPI002EF95FE8
MTNGSDETRGGIQVISRAAAVLRSLKGQREGLSLGQISEKVGLPRSTVQRIVGALQAEQLVIAATPDRGIRLGPELSSLAESARIDVVEILHPYLAELGERTGETIDLAVFRARRMVFVDQIPSAHRLRAVSSVGEAFPLTTTANGKACLAKLSDHQVLDLLQHEQPERFADVGRRQHFLDEIAAVRAAKVAFDRDEHTDGISAIGASFFDLQGNLYAISIPTPSSRFARSEPKIVRELLKTLARIDKLEIVSGT